MRRESAINVYFAAVHQPTSADQIHDRVFLVGFVCILQASYPSPCSSRSGTALLEVLIMLNILLGCVVVSMDLDLMPIPSQSSSLEAEACKDVGLRVHRPPCRCLDERPV
jgi:hypothetical protein